jgi:hypothetical protein
MTLDQAKAMFKSASESLADELHSGALYDAAYAYATAQGFDPMETGDWQQALLLLRAIAPEQSVAASEALILWMQDSKLRTVAECAELCRELKNRTEGFSERYIRAEIERGNLKAMKRGKRWLVTNRAFREWWRNAKRGERGCRIGRPEKH